jgi:hypothetical protein
VFVTVSDQGVTVEPAEVPPGQVLVCLGADRPGRLVVAEFQVDDAFDVAGLVAVEEVSGADLLAMPGVRLGEHVRMAATLDSADDLVRGLVDGAVARTPAVLGRSAGCRGGRGHGFPTTSRDTSPC